MVEIGDWIEMSKYGADGDVIDIGLNVVKVETLIKQLQLFQLMHFSIWSFKNYRGMMRIRWKKNKRAIKLIYIVLNS